MNSAIGIDPDTKTTGIAIIHPNGQIELRLARSKGRFADDRFPGMAAALLCELPLARFELSQPGMKLEPVAAVEFQHIRPRGEKNPNSMMGVQAVAGMAVTALIARKVCPGDILTPLPVDWKGSIPKEVHQRRILREAGLHEDSPEFHGIPKSMRQHVIDALGLAMWARKQKT